VHSFSAPSYGVIRWIWSHVELRDATVIYEVMIKCGRPHHCERIAQVLANATQDHMLLLLYTVERPFMITVYSISMFLGFVWTVFVCRMIARGNAARKTNVQSRHHHLQQQHHVCCCTSDETSYHAFECIDKIINVLTLSQSRVALIALIIAAHLACLNSVDPFDSI
jgi:hypothetical protein